MCTGCQQRSCNTVTATVSQQIDEHKITQFTAAVITTHNKLNSKVVMCHNNKVHERTNGLHQQNTIFSY